MPSSYKPTLPDPPGQSGLGEVEKEIAWEEHSLARARKQDEAAKAEAHLRGNAIQLDEKAENSKSGWSRILRK
jgi:hypothetical protein